MTTEDKQLLVEKFGSIVEAEDIQSECLGLMKQFSLTAEELFWKWESYVLNSGSDLSLSSTELKKLQEYIMTDLEKENQRTVKKPRLSLPASARKVGSPESFLDSMLSTPASRKRRTANGSNGGSSSISQLTPSRLKNELSQDMGSSPNRTPVHPLVLNSTPTDTPYRARQGQPGKIVETLNESIVEPESDRDSVPENNVSFQLNVDLKKYNYRTMRMKLTEVAEYFDERIESLIKSLLESSSEVTEEHIGNPAVMSQSEIIVVGRIVADSVDKLNPGSIILETCRRIGAGMQTRLDVSHLGSYSLFPGQIVALRGQNSDGSAFRVSEILQPLQMISAATSRQDVEQVIQRQSKPASIITAAGPFTTSDNLFFEPLDDLVQHINNTHPDVVILIGPFLDTTHPLIQSGDFEIPGENGPMENGTLDDLFRALVTPRLNSINSDTTVIVIPSVRDTAANHAAFPQQQLDRKHLKLSKHVKCLSNPATFSLNEVVFTVNSVDAIKDLAATMVQYNPKQRGLFGAINHILDSRSMYPVFPAPQKISPEGAELNGGSIDVPFMGLAEFTHAMPDVLITSSMLKPLAEISQNVLVINPGLLSKKTSGGTYASLTIKPPSVGANEEDEMLGHELWNRARVDIVKM